MARCEIPKAPRAWPEARKIAAECADHRDLRAKDALKAWDAVLSRAKAQAQLTAWGEARSLVMVAPPALGGVLLPAKVWVQSPAQAEPQA